MCGIFGSFSKNLLEHGIQEKMCNRINHRGPDSDGFYTNINFGISLFHKRLSILDLSNTGNQPMFSSKKRWVISYNG